jgi:ADP-ribose pyrophosphatase
MRLETIDRIELKNQSRLKVYEDTVVLPNKNQKKHLTVDHPGAVVILPINDNKDVVFLRQYRHSIEQEIFELPAGTLNKDEDPLLCAKRELSEETGFTCDSLLHIGKVLPAPGFCNELQHLFFAQNLYEHSLEKDEDEFIEVVTASVNEFESMIQDGRIIDGKSIVAFAKCRMLELI